MTSSTEKTIKKVWEFVPATEEIKQKIAAQELREKIMTKQKGMDTYTACSIVEGFDGEEHTQEEEHEAWQFLIDNGMAWQLQGWYGRMAKGLIDEGICHWPERKQA